MCVWAALVLFAACGCQTAPREIFAALHPPLVWPSPPDAPRIRYLGELRGEASLERRPSGLAALRAALTGPRPQVQFLRPAAVAVAGERVFVADTGVAGVHVLDLAQRTYRLATGNPADPLRAPIDLAVAGSAELVVVDRVRAALDWLDLDGNWLRTQRWEALSAPVSAAWDAGRGTLWVADAAAHAVFALRGGSAPVRAIGGRGSGPGEFNYPAALAVAGGELLVADSMNFRVQRFDGSLAPVLVFGQKGDAAGDFALPRDVAVDSTGHVYVLDNQFENVQIFDRAGRLLLAFGGGGSGPGEFSVPAGITIDARDRIWIADSYNRRVQVFEYLAGQDAEETGGAPTAQESKNDL